MTIAQAIETAAKEAGWSVTKIAAEASVVETTAIRWTRGVTVPDGNRLEILRRRLPGLAELLDARVAA